MKKKLCTLLAAVLTLSLVLASCGGPSSSSSEEPAASGSGSTSQGETTSGPKDEVVTMAIISTWNTLNVYNTSGNYGNCVADQMFERMVSCTHDGEYLPRLANSWEMADDNMSMTFYLNENATWHDGEPLTADDVVYSIERILNDPTLEMGVYLMRLQEVKKVDDYTVQLVTKVPYPVFSGSLTHIMMLDKETCEGLSNEEIADNPVGTGRYRLVEHVKGSSIKLERNDEWWGDELPEAETVEFRVIANDATRTTALLNGEVDFISNIPVMDADRISSSEGVQVITSPSLSCNYLGFDLLNETGSDGTDDPNPLMIKEVRQAIYHAINIDEIIDVVMNGYATVANSYMPSICVGYNPDAERPAYDPDLAKELLAEAGYPDGFNLRIDGNSESDVNADQLIQAVATYLERVGIKTEVNLIPRASFYEKTDPENLQSSCYMAGWGDGSGEGMVIFNDMVYTYNGKEGLGEGNRGHYSNPEVDALLDQASVESDQAKRAELVSQVDDITRDDAGYIPLFFKDNIFGVREGLEYTPRSDDHILAWDFKF